MNANAQKLEEEEEYAQQMGHSVAAERVGSGASTNAWERRAVAFRCSHHLVVHLCLLVFSFRLTKSRQVPAVVVTPNGLFVTLRVVIVATTTCMPTPSSALTV